MNVSFLGRDFTPRLAPAGVDFTVGPYSHHAIGGPLEATLTATGKTIRLLDLLDWLRCGVVVKDKRLTLLWWGYIHAVDVATKTGTVGVSLDTLNNAVQVVYSKVDPGVATVGTRATTASVWNGASIGVYGSKELHASVDGATTAQANALRDALLTRGTWPSRRIDLDRAGAGATLYCKGWWATLDWRYYTNAGTASTETTAQISAIETAIGDMLVGTRIVNASGIFSSQYRDGDTTGQKEIVDLLASGTTNGRRLLARVTVDRLLEVYEEPAPAATNWYLGAGGKVYDAYQQPLDPATCPVAFWAGYKDMPGAGLALSYISPAGPVFIEETSYDPASGKLSLRPRDVPSPWDLLRYKA